AASRRFLSMPRAAHSAVPDSNRLPGPGSIERSAVMELRTRAPGKALCCRLRSWLLVLVPPEYASTRSIASTDLSLFADGLQHQESVPPVPGRFARAFRSGEFAGAGPILRGQR